MSNKIIKSAEDLDKISASNISELITIEEADKIVSVWGLFLEHAGFMSYLFSGDIPESVLPYPKYLLVGAINKMAKYYHQQGHDKMVENLESTLIGLVSYANDKEAIKQASENFNNKEWLEHFVPGLNELQRDRMENGFVVDGKLWKLSKSRIEEIENSLEIKE